MTGTPKANAATIFLVRHGEVDNPSRILPGRLPNFHLSVHGRAQAKQAGLFLQKQHIDIIYTSPLERCRETADIIRHETGASAPLFAHNDLTEIKTARDGELVARPGLVPVETIQKEIAEGVHHT